MCDIPKQVRQLFNHPSFSKRVRLRRRSRGGKKGNRPVRDLHDSPWWQSEILGDSRIMSDSRNLVLALASDGVPPFDKQINKYSMNVMMLMILNLPPWERESVQNIMLAGIFQGPEKCANQQPILYLLSVIKATYIIAIGLLKNTLIALFMHGCVLLYACSCIGLSSEEKACLG